MYFRYNRNRYKVLENCQFRGAFLFRMRVSIPGCELFLAATAPPSIRTDDISKANACLPLRATLAILFLIKKDEMDVERKLIRRRERRATENPVTRII